MQSGGDEEHKVEGESGKILRQDHLPGLYWSGHEGFEGPRAFFLGKEPHGDEGEDEEGVEPEVGGVIGHVDQGFGYGGIGKSLHGGGKADALHQGDKGEDHPAEEGVEERFQFFAVKGEKQAHAIECEVPEARLLKTGKAMAKNVICV